MTASTLPKRNQVPVELTWDLTSMYAPDADWEADFTRVKEALPKLATYKGRLNRLALLLLRWREPAFAPGDWSA